MATKKQPTPIKKKGVSEFNLTELKNKIGLISDEKNLSRSNAIKTLEWYVLPNAWTEATQLPGLAIKGRTTCVTGWSDTGKSTIFYCNIAAIQRQGDIPIIYDTEGTFSFKHAIECGLEATPVYGNVEEVNQETGEVSIVNKIINYEGDFIFFSNSILAELYGNWDYKNNKQVKTKRKVPVIEDVFKSMNYFADLQDGGEFPRNIVFLWDSIGSLMSYETYSNQKALNTTDAAVYESCIRLFDSRVIATQSINSPYYMSLFTVNKIWDSSMSTMGKPSFELKGGKAMYWRYRLIAHLGGVSKASVSKKYMTIKGNEVLFATETKVEIKKNHLDSPWNLTRKGKFYCTATGIISENELDTYKKNRIPIILEELAQKTGEDFTDVKYDDIEFKTVDVDIENNEE